MKGKTETKNTEEQGAEKNISIYFDKIDRVKED
jgi:hypothetical protein